MQLELRQPHLTSYFMVSNLREALPNRDGTKLARGNSILQYPNRDASQRWHRAQSRRTTNRVLGRYQAVQKPLPRLPLGVIKGIMFLDIPHWCCLMERHVPSAALPVSIQKKAFIMPFSGKLL